MIRHKNMKSPAMQPKPMGLSNCCGKALLNLWKSCGMSAEKFG